MKRIGLTQRLLDNDAYPEQREALDVRWGELLCALGWLPVPLCVGIEANLARSLDGLGIEGVLLTGGNDLASVSPSPLSARRDQFERAVLDWAASRSMPVLGVCRGAQFMAVHHGSSLKPTEGHVATRHPIRVDDSTVLGRFLGQPADVNSYHGYAIAELGANLVPVASAPDGGVEAFSHRGLPQHAIMWHPERESPVPQSDLAVLKGVFA